MEEWDVAISVDVNGTIKKLNELLDSGKIKSETEIELAREILNILEFYVLEKNDIKSYHDAMPYWVYKELEPIVKTYRKLMVIINDKNKND